MTVITCVSQETMSCLDPPPQPGHYTLPDMTEITLSPSQMSLPDTLLQGPDSVQSSFSSAISRLDPDISAMLCRHVVLAGGTTDCPGFREHLLRSLEGAGAMVTMTQGAGGASSSGRYKSWVGGSVLASLSSFSRMSVLRSEYEEAGSGLINRRCIMEDGADDIYGLYGFSGS